MINQTHPHLPERFAVLADIHGNSSALKAVLDDMASHAPQAMLVLGDHFSGPLDPAGTAEQLLGLTAFSLRGNHDRYLCDQARADMGPSDQVAYDSIGKAAFDWLAGLPQVLDFGDVWACHATPFADDIYWTHCVDERGDVLPRAMEQIESWAEGLEASLLLCAHTHLPDLLHLSGGRHLLNPGSVGCPAYSDDRPVPHIVQTRTPAATWAMVSRVGKDWRIAHHHVFYDPTEMAARARHFGREGWARAVSTGRL